MMALGWCVGVWLFLLLVVMFAGGLMKSHEIKDREKGPRL